MIIAGFNFQRYMNCGLWRIHDFSSEHFELFLPLIRTKIIFKVAVHYMRLE